MRDQVAALRAFRLVAEHASFTRAAAVLDVTPSALSQTLLQLEKHLEVRLLQRRRGASALPKQAANCSIASRRR